MVNPLILKLTKVEKTMAKTGLDKRLKVAKSGQKW